MCKLSYEAVDILINENDSGPFASPIVEVLENDNT